jgi:hypothetical protein
MWALNMELALCYPFGAQNFEVASSLLENLCTTHITDEEYTEGHSHKCTFLAQQPPSGSGPSHS